MADHCLRECVGVFSRVTEEANQPFSSKSVRGCMYEAFLGCLYKDESFSHIQLKVKVQSQLCVVNLFFLYR